MKRFIPHSLFVVTAALLSVLAPAALGQSIRAAGQAPAVAHGANATSPFPQLAGQPGQTPSRAAVSGLPSTMEASIESRMPAQMLARRKAMLASRQRFQQALRTHSPLGTLKPMDSNPATVNFPGFQQADVLTAGVGAGDPTNAIAALTADVNKDGFTDLINLQIDGTVSVLLNPGAGKLSSMQVSSVNTSAGNSRHILYAATADLNGDGYPELISIDYASNSLLIYPNKKDGTFGPAAVQPVKFSSGSSMLSGGGMAIGDFNGDGTLDVAVYMMDYGYSGSNQTATSFELVVLPGAGDGTFHAQLPEQYTLLNSYGTTMPGQVAVGDVNNDGHLDISYMAGGFDDSQYEEVYVATLLGDGTGKFTAPPTDLPKSGAIAVGIADGSIVGGITLADFDGDGNLDVLFANCENANLYYAKGNGDGTFQNATTPVTDLGYPNALSFADMNGDGLIDVISYGDGYTAIFAGQGKGAFAQPVTKFASGMAGYVPGQPADFDGDGQLDLARTDIVTDLTAIYLEKNGVFNASPVLSPPGETPSYFQAITAGDFNGDGFQDVIGIDYTAYWSGTQNHEPYPDIVIGLNDGKGNFTYSVAIGHEALYTMGGGDADSGLLYPAAADFNGDNLPDLLLTDQNGHLWIALSNGKAQFATPSQLSIGIATQCRFSRIDIGDLNNDGKQDVVLAYPGDSSCSSGPVASGVMSLLSKGDGTFTAKFSAVGASAQLPKLIDFNGDGKLDLALADVNSDEFAFDFFVVPGNGDGTFDSASASRPLPTGTAVTAIMAGDFNSDGKQDLTVGTLFREDEPFDFLPNTTGVETLTGNGDFTFGAPQMYAFGGYPYDGQYGDFNGDGKPDLVMNIGYDYFQNSPILSSFGYLVNQGDGTFGAFQPSVSTTYDVGGFFYAGDYNSYGNLVVADFNGDGALDVLSVLDYDEAYHYASQLFLNSGAVNFTLAANAATVAQDSPVTITAMVKASVGTKSPTGKVSFFDNGTLVGSVDVASNSAVYTDSNPAVGTHVYTATYAGDANFNAAKASAAVNVVVNVLPPAFTLAQPSPGTLSMIAGGSGTLQLSLASNATFNGSVALTCTGAPTLATCSFAPASVTLTGNQTGTATLTVATQPTTTAKALKAAVDNAPKLLPGAGVLSLATLLAMAWPGRIRRVRRMWMVLILGSITALTMGMSGCGSDSKKTVAGTPTGTYTLTITATSGTQTESQTVTLNVQ